MEPLTAYLTLAAVLFGLGLLGALRRSNLIMMLMSIELMLNAVNINFLAFNRFAVTDSVQGHIFAIFIIAVAAAEAAIGLAIVLMLGRSRDVISVHDAETLKG